MITSDRNIFVGAHTTLEVKERFRKEADRRKLSMSALISNILEEWIDAAEKEQLEPVRSNKRGNPNGIDVPLPFLQDQ